MNNNPLETWTPLVVVFSRLFLSLLKKGILTLEEIKYILNASDVEVEEIKKALEEAKKGEEK